MVLGRCPSGGQFAFENRSLICVEVVLSVLLLLHVLVVILDCPLVPVCSVLRLHVFIHFREELGGPSGVLKTDRLARRKLFVK